MGFNAGHKAMSCANCKHWKHKDMGIGECLARETHWPSDQERTVVMGNTCRLVIDGLNVSKRVTVMTSEYDTCQRYEQIK